jgi:hypothetical protein
MLRSSTCSGRLRPRAALETEKKQVKGELLFPLFVCWSNSFGDPLPSKFVLLFSGPWTALGKSMT